MNHPMRWLSMAPVLFAWTFSPSAGTPVIVIDHKDCPAAEPEGFAGCNPVRSLILKQGQVFTVRIINTDSISFDYTIAGVLAKSATDTTRPFAAAPGTDVALLTQAYDSKYAGYIVKIRLKPNKQSGSLRGNLDATINITESKWNVGFGSGFVISGLTDPAFIVRDSTVTPKSGAPYTRPTFERQRSREDAAALGLGAFVHLFHSQVPWIAATFGLGIQNQSTSPTYYLGPSLRLGDVGAFTTGVAFGSVHTAPSGVRIGDSVSSTNTLNNLGSHITAQWFVALSYSFISGSQAALSKPFAGNQGTTGAPTTPTAKSPTEPPPGPTATPAPAPDVVEKAVSLDGDKQQAALNQQPKNPLSFVVQKGANPVPSQKVTWSVSPAGAVDFVNSASGTAANGSASTMVKILKEGTATVTATMIGIGETQPDGTKRLTVTFTVSSCVAGSPGC